MANFFLYIVMTGTVLAAGAQAQETTPPAMPPSVADAARAARERRESMTPKRIMTDDDVAAKRGAGDSANMGASEQEVRAEMEKNYSQPLTKADMTRQITQMQAVEASGDAGMLTSFKRSALAGYEGVEFPGKKEWEQSLSVAASRMVEEAGKGVTRLQAIVDGNQNAIAGRDPTALARMRETWIDALLPYATWQQRTRDLMEGGKARAKAYATGNSAGAAEYLHEAVRRNENAVGGMLSSMHIVEDELRNVQGHYACEAAQWPRDPRHPEIPNAMWTIYMNTASGAGYRLDIQGCDARHYSAVAIPPASDGSQGRAFCMDESGVVRVAPDGNPTTCISRGSEWVGR
jgi:hypothetical protein